MDKSNFNNLTIREFYALAFKIAQNELNIELSIDEDKIDGAEFMAFVNTQDLNIRLKILRRVLNEIGHLHPKIDT